MTITDRVGNVPEGLGIKAPCRVATTANIVLAGLQTIDGVALAANERVLVWQQTDAKQNGIYQASTGNWTRPNDANNNQSFILGTQIYIAFGTLHGTQQFVCTAVGDPVVLGSTNLTFAKFGIPGSRLLNTTAPLVGGGALSSDLTLSLSVAPYLYEAFVAYGLVPAPQGTSSAPPAGMSLMMTTSAGVMFVQGREVAVAQFSHTYTASRDTYDFISTGGVVTHSAVANGAAAPAAPADSVLLQQVVTNASGVLHVIRFCEELPAAQSAWGVPPFRPQINGHHVLYADTGFDLRGVDVCSIQSDDATTVPADTYLDANPQLILSRLVVGRTPEADDLLAVLQFSGATVQSPSALAANYVSLNAYIVNPGTGSAANQQGGLRIQTWGDPAVSAGSYPRLDICGDGIILYEKTGGGTAPTGSFAGSGTINSHGLFVQGKPVVTSDAGNVTLSGQLVATGGIQVTKASATPELSTARSDAHGSGVTVGRLAFYGKDGSANVEQYARIDCTVEDHTAASEDSSLHFYACVAGTLAARLDLLSGALAPSTNDNLALGTSMQQYSDLWLAAGGQVNFNGGSVSITESADALLFGGASSGYAFDSVIQASVAANAARFINTTDNASVQVAKLEGDRATMAANDQAYLSMLLSNSAGTQFEFGRQAWIATDVTAASEDGALLWSVALAGALTAKLRMEGSTFSPAASGGTTLGSTTLPWNGLRLASGATIAWDNSDVVLNHSANEITITGATNAYYQCNVAPLGDNTYTSGTTANRWSAVWAANGTIQTSDRLLKASIEPSELGLEFVRRLSPVSYRWKDGGGGKPGKRRHFGLMAQDVRRVLDELEVEDFGGWVRDDLNDPDSGQSLRYDQFIAPLVRAVQELAERVH